MKHLGSGWECVQVKSNRPRKKDKKGKERLET